MPVLAPLPIDEVVPELLRALAERSGAVLTAPPGAGKTTRVPPAIAEAGLLASGHPAVVMLQPRRVAARAAAARIADERGWRIGDQVGWHIRFDNRTGPKTRVRVLTEGILTRRLLADPFLEGVGCVILDEFHERSIHTDLALALLREIQRSVRPDLRILVMSATMDPGPVSRFLGDVPVLESQGRMYPVEIAHLAERDPRANLWDLAAAAVKRALARPLDESGHLLVFLPGMREIRRTAERLDGIDADVHVLHGSASADDQDRALAPSARRKAILATNIAETSLTIDGVRTVIDGGVARVPYHDPRLGIDRLETRRISRASAEQRAGRAGRTAPGRCVRLWTSPEDGLLSPAEAPEIHRIDLASTLLTLKAWGSADSSRFEWFEPPKPDALARAERLLALLGAADAKGQLTDLGRALARLPLHPRLGSLLVFGAQRGLAREAAGIAALAAEDELSGHGGSARSGASDILDRLESLERGRLEAGRAIERVRDDLLRMVKEEIDGDARPGPRDREEKLLRLLLHAWPDRVTRRREPGSPRGVMAGGRGVVLDESSGVRKADFFLSIDIRDSGNESRVFAASAVERAWLEEDMPHLCAEGFVHRFDDERRRVVTLKRFAYMDIALDERIAGPHMDPEGASAALAEALSPRAAEMFARDEDATRTLARLRFLARAMPDLKLPDFGDTTFSAIVREACAGKTSADDVEKGIADALRLHLTREQRRALDEHAPESVGVPSGKRAKLEYNADDPSRAPVMAVRLQELFGMMDAPRVAAGRVPVVVQLLGPNYRPVQTTQDLRGFWSRTYPEVRRELRARYPKHSWPDDPFTAVAVAGAPRRRRESP